MIEFLVLVKFRFDQGSAMASQAIGIFNSSLLIILAGDKIKILTGVQHTRTLVIGSALTYLVGAWVLGFLLDKIGYFAHYNETSNKRNPMLKRIAGE